MADVEEHSFSEGSFDAILSSSAIPYLQHVPRTFERFCAWLKKGGSFVFSTPQVRLRNNLCNGSVITYWSTGSICMSQSPEYEAAFALNTLNRLVMERFGVRLADAAAETGVPDRVERVLHGAGFSTVQVTHTASSPSMPQPNAFLPQPNAALTQAKCCSDPTAQPAGSCAR